MSGHTQWRVSGCTSTEGPKDPLCKALRMKTRQILHHSAHHEAKLLLAREEPYGAIDCTINFVSRANCSSLVCNGSVTTADCWKLCPLTTTAQAVAASARTPSFEGGKAMAKGHGTVHGPMALQQTPHSNTTTTSGTWDDSKDTPHLLLELRSYMFELGPVWR